MRGYSALTSQVTGEGVGLDYSMNNPNALRVGKEEKNPRQYYADKQTRKEKAESTAGKTFSLLSLGQFGAVAVLVLLICLPMLQKWSVVWGNRNAWDKDDIHSFYYNDSYTIELADGTEKIIEYYNPNIDSEVEESPYMEEVENYEELSDVYSGSVGGSTVNGLEDALGTLNTALEVGYKVFDKIANAVEVVQRYDDYYNWNISKLWNKLKNLVTNIVE